MEKVDILLIEDNEADKDYIAELLSNEENIEYNIFWKDRLEEALSYFKKNKIDMVLLDLSLPDSHGIDTFLKANSVIKKIPIIILTGLEKEELGIKCIKKGAQDYLFKNHINKYILKKSINYSIERKKSENEIEWLKNYLSNIIDSMPSILVAIDKNYEIILWNERAQNFTHTIRENAIGKNLFSVFSLLMHYKTKIDKCLKNNEIKSIKEEKINLENKEYYFNLTVFPLKAESDEKDKIWNHEGGAVIIVDDITDYIELKKKYEQSQKMESLGQLTGGIAHDFNNILGGIQNACYLLKNNKHDKKKYDKYLNMITKLSGRASNLTNKLLNFSRIEHVSNKVINLKKIINEVTDILKSNLNKKAKIEAEFKTDRAYVRGNFSQLQTVLLNIGLNSLDAIENNGYVKYQISKTKLKNIDLDDFENKDLHKEYINITVADNGKGIPSEIQNKIFDPFFTTKNRKEGTGLGLSSAIGIIKNHGGHIDFESAENSGTKFYIYLPKYEDNRKITYKEKNKIDNPNREYEGSILVIDDEEAIRSTTKELLKISGFKVITAENGKAAINKFEQTNNEIDVVLLDMVMPDMNGNECFDKLKKINPDVPIIIISGYSSIENRKQLKNKGVQHFISKPFEIGELSEKISDILAEK